MSLLRRRTRFAGRNPTLAASFAALALAACGGDARGNEGGAVATSLGQPAALRSPAAPGSAEPNLVAGEDGRVYLTWIEPGPDSSHVLRFSTLQGDAWTEPRTIARGADWFVNWADFPSLSVLPGGRLAAHWLQKSGAGTYAYDVRVAQSADGGQTWGPGVVPHSDRSPSEHGFASLWAAGDSVGAVWLDGRKYGAAGEGEKGEMMLISALVDASGAPGAERVLDARVCDCCQTGMAVTSAGPIVVYRDRSPDEIRDIYAVRFVSGAWEAPKPVHADGWKIAACPVNGPQVSADGDFVAVAWFTAARDTARVYAAFSRDAGATFGAPVRIDDGNPAGRVDVEVVPGGALVSWVERAGGESAEVRVRHVAADGKLGAPRTVASSSAERASGFPRMAISNGNVVFAYTVPGKPSQVQVARAPLARE